MSAPGSFEDQVRSMLNSNQASTPYGQPASVTSPGRHRRPNQAQRLSGMQNRVDLTDSHPQMFSQDPRQHEQAYRGQPAFGRGASFASHGSLGPHLDDDSVKTWRNLAATSQAQTFHQQSTFPSPRHPQGSYAGPRGAGIRQTYNAHNANGPVQQPQSAASNRNTTAMSSNNGHTRFPTQGRSLYDPHTRLSLNTDMRPPFRQADYLERLANARIPIAGMSNETLAMNEHVRGRLQVLCKEALRENAETMDIPEASVLLECFGSIASGFATADSDMDVMLLHQNSPGATEKHKVIPRLIEKALLDAGFGARLLTRTRVPIIRFCEYPPGGLLEKLRAARAEWEIEAAKLLAEGKSADDAVEGVGHEGDEHGEDGAEGSPEESVGDENPSDGEKAQSPTDAAAKKIAKKTKEPKEPRPLPYKNDEERIQLYKQAIIEDWFEPEERRIIARYTDAYKQAAGKVDDPNLEEARKALDTLPDVLSRYRDPRQRKQELEYPKDGVGVLCDINFAIGSHSNPLAIHNTRLLRCYSLFDDRIRQMVIFVKAWAKIRKINKPYHGTLSSYGYVLMVLHFAVNLADPPLAPNLQELHSRNAETEFDAPTDCEGYDIRFWQDPKAIKAAARAEFGRNKQSVGSLLCQFFRHYAVNTYKGVEGYQWMKHVLSLRTPGGLISKESKGWTGATEQAKAADDTKDGPVMITHRYLLAIEDPFEHTHNVGRPVMHHGIIAIRDEFRRANQLILSQGIFNNTPEDFFTECAEKERAPRYFGPNPKHKRPVRFGPQNLVGDARIKALEKAVKLTEKKEAAAENLSDPKLAPKPSKAGSAAKSRDRRPSHKSKATSVAMKANDDTTTEAASFGILTAMTKELSVDVAKQAQAQTHSAVHATAKQLSDIAVPGQVAKTDEKSDKVAEAGKPASKNKRKSQYRRKAKAKPAAGEGPSTSTN